MPIRKEIYKKAAIERLKDAEVLRQQGRRHTMIYLMGFVLECALAHAYCVNNNENYIEDVKTYDKSVWNFY